LKNLRMFVWTIWLTRADLVYLVVDAHVSII